MAWELRLAPIWAEEARAVDSLSERVALENAEAERLMNEGWEVIATAPTSSTYGIQLVMRREKTYA